MYSENSQDTGLCFISCLGLSYLCGLRPTGNELMVKIHKGRSSNSGTRVSEMPRQPDKCDRQWLQFVPPFLQHGAGPVDAGGRLYQIDCISK